MYIIVAITLAFMWALVATAFQIPLESILIGGAIIGIIVGSLKALCDD